MSRPVLLAARAVEWKAGGRRILGPLDFELSAGESVAVVGPNGAGKTTLLRLLTGLLSPSGGEIEWSGVRLASLGRRRLSRHIAYVPQDRPGDVPLTVDQLVMLGRYPYLTRLQVAPRSEDFAAVERALETVGISVLRHRRLGELSGGERQAAFIAAALAQETELLVLDEPTVHLDPGHQRKIAAVVKKLHRRDGCSVLTATHDLNLASLLADRVLALRQGTVLACGTPAEILEPSRLSRLFGARFEVVRSGDRPVTVLELDR